MFKFLKIFTAMFIATFALSLFFTCEATAAGKTSPSVKTQGEKIIVYYFYSKPRCVSCKKIEKYTQLAVKELNSKKVTYSAIDLDNPTNKSYAEKYKLFTKSVVLSKQKNGKETNWKNLDAIWTKLGNEKNFKLYITTEIKKFGG